MSDTNAPSSVPGDAIRPLSVRMLDSTRAQLEVLAQINERSVTEEVRLALEAWIFTSRSDPAIQKRSQEVRAEIEREAAVRRVAIESIFDAPAQAGRQKRASAPES